jgi:hypothetical protein
MVMAKYLAEYFPAVKNRREIRRSARPLKKDELRHVAIKLSVRFQFISRSGRPQLDRNRLVECSIYFREATRSRPMLLVTHAFEGDKWRELSPPSNQPALTSQRSEGAQRVVGR